MWTEEWWVDFVAGWASGAVSVVACQPLDTVLTRFQAGKGVVATAGAGVTGTVCTSTSTSVTALGSGVRDLAKEFGIGSLWRGSSPMIGAVPVQNALLMGGYGLGKRYSEAHEHDHSTNLLPVFVGGCAGGILQSFLMSPVEWIKVHQQTQPQTATNAATTATTTTRSLVRNLFRDKNRLWNRGLTATLLRDGIPHGVWFASYEYCKTQLLQLRAEKEATSEGDFEIARTTGNNYESVAVPLVSGAFAATTAWTVGYPFDIIKTRIQATAAVASASSAAGGISGKVAARVQTRRASVPGVLETARLLVAEADGQIIRGLYRGFGWKLVRSIPASMIGFLTYEVVSKELLGKV